MSNVLLLKNITRVFEQGGHRLDVLRGANMAVARGEIVALLGPSGSGKTTLLQIAGLLEPPTGGDVIIDGKNLSGAPDKVRTECRRTSIGFVYQFHHLLPDFTALENLLLPQYINGVSKKDALQKAESLLHAVALEKRAGHFPSELSGGEQQRIAIARALVNNPALLLADEPTGNLDPATAENVFQILLQTVRGFKIGGLIVTHNMDLARRMDRVLQIKNGEIVEG